jgi:hypothetical protein
MGYCDVFAPIRENQKRTRRSIQRRVTLLFEFELPSPPWMAYTLAR